MISAPLHKTNRKGFKEKIKQRFNFLSLFCFPSFFSLFPLVLLPLSHHFLLPTTQKIKKPNQKKKQKQKQKHKNKNKNKNKKKKTKTKKKNQNKKKPKQKNALDMWYIGVFSLVKEMSVIKHFSNQYQFSSEFLRQSCVHASRNLIVEQSPHPYPNGGFVFVFVFVFVFFFVNR